MCVECAVCAKSGCRQRRRKRPRSNMKETAEESTITVRNKKLDSFHYAMRHAPGVENLTSSFENATSCWEIQNQMCQCLVMFVSFKNNFVIGVISDASWTLPAVLKIKMYKLFKSLRDFRSWLNVDVLPRTATFRCWRQTSNKTTILLQF